MTQLEMRAMSAIIALNRKVKDSYRIDWEQRRYVIAKEVMANEASKGSFSKDAAKYAVACADALIEELKGGK